MFLGLTGTRMNPADALFVGMADRFVSHELKGQVIDARPPPTQGSSAHSVVSSVCASMNSKAEALPASPVRDHFDDIQQATDGDSLEQVAQLKDLAAERAGWAKP